MVAPKKDERPAAPKVTRVLVPFAYATAKNGEVVQLAKNDLVNVDRFTGQSLDHLRSIGFIGEQN